MNILGIGLLLLQVQLGAASGIVTKPGGNEPLTKATVLLNPVATGQSARQRSAVTEDDGRFEIRDIQPGDYRLTVQNVRYGQAAFGQRKPGGPGTILSIAPGQQLSDMRISMIPTGAIAGRITGRDGEPLVRASVQAFKYAYQDGRKILTVAQGTRTDDRGEYRLYWLPAGQYLVAATASDTSTGQGSAELRPGSSSPASDLARGDLELAMLLGAEANPAGNTKLRILDDGTTQEEAWAPVFYPASTEPRLATALNLSSETTVTGINIAVGPARVQRIRGHVTGFTRGITPTVTLVPQDTTAGLRIVSRGASNIDGSFEFSGVMPGSYYLLARDLRTRVLSSTLPVQIGDRDLDNLTLGMIQAITLTGRIVLEGATQNSGGPDPFSAVSISLMPDLMGASLGALASFPTAANGEIVWNNIPPGDYQLQFASGARDTDAKPLYMKSARLGLTDVTGGIRISSNTNDRVEIVLTTDPGSVEGVAIGLSGGPAANTTVVLVPTVARQRSSLYKSVVTGTDGRFKFQDLTPGDYKLFAWDDVETGAWQDPEFIRAYESKGRLVRIAEKGKEDVQLNVIYNP